MLDEGRLHGMQAPVLRQSFYGRNLAALRHHSQRQASEYAATVDVNSACAAFAAIAAFADACQRKLFAQRIEQRRARIDRECVLWPLTRNRISAT